MDGLALPLGDDAAVLDVPPGRQVVVTTDVLIEGIHFRRDWSDPYSIGWKAAAVNLSDIAAMGADPTFTFVSLALTPEETVERLERLYDGLSRLPQPLRSAPGGRGHELHPATAWSSTSRSLGRSRAGRR